MVEKMKTDVDRLLLVSKLKKSLILAKYIGKYVFTVKTKSSPSTSIFILSAISQILETNLYLF